MFGAIAGVIAGDSVESNFSHLMEGLGWPSARQSTLSSWFTLTAISLAGSLIHWSLTKSPQPRSERRAKSNWSVVIVAIGNIESIIWLLFGSEFEEGINGI